MPATHSADEVRRQIVERYTTAGARAADATRGVRASSAGSVNLMDLDLSTEDGPTVLLDVLEPGTLAQVAGYTDEEIAALPPDALKGSFACATPLRFAQLQPGQTVLDIGCGQGVDLILAAHAVGQTGRGIGVDLTATQVEQAQRNVATAGLANAEVRQGGMEALPVESETVDWIISNGAINYSPEKPQVFAEALRVLRPGGRLAIADVLIEDLADAFAYRLFGYVSNAGGAVGLEAYTAMIHDAGFADVHIADRRAYSAEDMLRLTGYADSPDTQTVGELRPMLDLLRGTIATAVITAHKPA